MTWHAKLRCGGLLLALFAIAASPAHCRSNHKDRTSASQQQGAGGFNYSEGAVYAWTGVCADGRQQSPIDVPLAALSGYTVVPEAVRASRAESTAGIKFDYNDWNDVKVFNNGHTIELEGGQGGGNTATAEGDKLTFLQMHLHSPSEHTIDDVRYAMEMHFVHRNERTQQLAVFGLLLDDTTRSEDGYNATSLMCQVLNSVSAANETEAGSEEAKVPLTACPGETESPAESMTSLLRQLEVTPFGQYAGSLTTPPCTEGVTWYVFTRAFHVELGQRAQFQALLRSAEPDANARPTQPLNGRTLRYQGIAFSAHPDA